jgi:hypothetical protein
MPARRASITSALVKKLYLDQGLSQRQISERLHCSPRLVFSRMREAGIALRTPSEAARLAHQRNGHRGPGLSIAAVQASRCPTSPTGSHHMILGKPRAEGIRGACKYCHAERLYPADVDARYITVAAVAGELGVGY